MCSLSEMTSTTSADRGRMHIDDDKSNDDILEDLTFDLDNIYIAMYSC